MTMPGQADGQPFTWNDAVINRLIDMRAEGRSAAQIGWELGCGRNAVLGKLHRLGLGLTLDKRKAGSKPQLRNDQPRSAPSGFKPAKAAPAPQRALTAQPEPVHAQVVTMQIVDAPFAPIRLLDAGLGHCRFAVDPRPIPSADMLVCGAPVAPGRSWCPTCATRVFDRAPRPVPRPWRPSR